MRWSIALFPREAKFFDLLTQATANLVKTAETFQEAVADLSQAASFAEEIKGLEHEGDRITRETVRMLHASLVTPIDREDINDLIQAVDDAVDVTEGVIERIALYRLHETKPPLQEMAAQLSEACTAADMAVQLLNKPRRYEDMDPYFDRIHEAEKTADRIYRGAIADLFNGTQEDILSVIKWREVYTHLEDAVDGTEKICDILQGIVVKSG